MSPSPLSIPLLLALTAGLGGCGPRDLPADAADVTELTIVDRWAGLNPDAPFEARFELAAVDGGMAGGAHFSAGHGRCARRLAVEEIFVPASAVGDFLTALAGSSAVEGEYEPDLRHTDDYPQLTVALSLVGGEELELHSASQGETRVPWRLRWRGKEYVVRSHHPYRAWTALTVHLPTEKLGQVIEEVQECR